MASISRHFLSLRFGAALFIFFAVFCATAAADTGQLVLSVRYSSNLQGYEAVLTYDDSTCVIVNDAISVEVIDYEEVLIESPWSEQLPCIVIPPISTYEKTAFIGHLEPGPYKVTWTQPDNFTRSIEFIAPGIVPIDAPWALLVLTFGVLGTAIFALRSHAI